MLLERLIVAGQLIVAELPYWFWIILLLLGCLIVAGLHLLFLGCLIVSRLPYCSFIVARQIYCCWVALLLLGCFTAVGPAYCFWLSLLFLNFLIIAKFL